MIASLGYLGAAGTLGEAVAGLWPDSAQASAEVSAAAGSELREALAGRRLVERPVAWGTTVWAASPGAVRVARSPNLLGRLEPVPSLPGTSLLVLDAGAPEPAPGLNALIVAGATGGFHMYSARARPGEVGPTLAAARADFDMRTDAARRLGKKLDQIAGVRLAHGPAESPSFVVLLPLAPGLVAAAVRDVAGGLAAEPVAGIPGLPGGLVVNVGRRVDDAAADHWLQIVADVVTDGREKS